MQSFKFDKLVPAIVFFMYVVFFFATLQSVPFHPDEATQIYMSRDVNLLLSNPSSLIYHQDTNLSPEQRYRLIDSPLTRTIIGFSRNIFHLKPLSADWNWSLTWKENQINGALPSKPLLLLARISLGVFVPIGLIFFFLILKKLIPWQLSLLVALFLGMNASFLVHTRRSMAEGISFALYFLILYLCIQFPQKIILLGLAVGFGLLTKQTILPVVFIPVIFWFIDLLRKKGFVSFIKSISVYLGLILLIYYLFNPIIWEDPIHITALQVQTRLAFSQSQAVEYSMLSSPLAVNSFLTRIIPWLANTFFAPPAYFDVGNYKIDLLPEIASYQSNFLNTFISGWLAGGILLFLSLLGFIGITRKIGKLLQKQNHYFLIIMVLSLTQTAFVLFFFPITFQRYYLLNLSLAVIWASIGLHIIWQIILNFRNWKK